MNLYDIARDAGTTRTVVSLVINGKADKYRIARATQDRVRAVVRRTGYVPNRFVHQMFLNRQRGEGAGSSPDPVRLKAAVEAALAATGYQLPVVAEEPGAISQAMVVLKPGMVAIVGAASVTSGGSGEWQAKPIPVIVPDGTRTVIVERVSPPTPIPAPTPRPAPPIPVPTPVPVPIPAPEREAGTSAEGQGEEEPPTPEPTPDPVPVTPEPPPPPPAVEPAP